MRVISRLSTLFNHAEDAVYATGSLTHLKLTTLINMVYLCIQDVIYFSCMYILIFYFSVFVRFIFFLCFSL